jgi:hypothetical protein
MVFNVRATGRIRSITAYSVSSFSFSNLTMLLGWRPRFAFFFRWVLDVLEPISNRPDHGYMVS